MAGVLGPRACYFTLAVKIVCELNERAVRAPRDKSRYGSETVNFLFRLEVFSRNFAALTGLGECMDVQLNIGRDPPVSKPSSYLARSTQKPAYGNLLVTY